MSIINNIVGKPICHKDIHDNMQKELFSYEFFLFVYFIHELTTTYSLNICLQPYFLFDDQEKCSYQIHYESKNKEQSQQFIDLICTPEKFNIPKEFILETPYVSLAINYMDKISRQLFPKNSTTIYLDNSLDWMEQFLYIIQEEDKIPYIRNKLLNNSLQNKLGYSYKTKI